MCPISHRVSREDGAERSGHPFLVGSRPRSAPTTAAARLVARPSARDEATRRGTSRGAERAYPDMPIPVMSLPVMSDIEPPPFVDVPPIPAIMERICCLSLGSDIISDMRLFICFRN